MNANVNQIERNLARLLFLNPNKREQLERVAGICYQLTSDTGVTIECELYTGHAVRYLITGTRCRMTVTADAVTGATIRKPRGAVPVITGTVHTTCYDVLKRCQLWEGTR